MQPPRTKRDLTSGNVASNVWHLAIPLIIQSALMDVFNIVDMIFVGRLGPEAIAAVSISGVLMGIIRLVAMGISSGTVALVSRLVGNKEEEEAKTVLGQSITLSLVSSVVMAVLGYLFAEPVLRALGAAEDVIPYGVSYLRIMCVGGVTMFLSIVLAAGMRGFGDATTPMIALGLASILNVGLDPLFIFGIGPFPRMEVGGSALATVISRAVGVITLIVVIYRREGSIRFFATKQNGHGNYFTRIFRIGWYSALRMASMNVSRLVLIRFIAAFGTYAVAAFGIGLRLRIFVLVLGFGLADSTAVNVGQNLGAGRPERAERAAWLSLGFFAAFLVLIAALFLGAPGAIIGIFNAHPEVIRMGRLFMFFFVPSLFFLDFAVVLGRAIEGAGSTRTTMLITFVSLIVVGIPAAWGFSVLWGVTGLWAAMAAADLLQGVGTFVAFRRGRWKLVRV